MPLFGKPKPPECPNCHMAELVPHFGSTVANECSNPKCNSWFCEVCHEVYTNDLRSHTRVRRVT